MSMIPVVTESNVQDTLRNLSDLTLLENPEMDHTCLDLVMGLLAFYRGRELDRERVRQEEGWTVSKSRGGMVSLILLLCLAAAATFAAVAGWVWWAGMLAVGLGMLSYLMILAEEEAK